MGRISGEVKKDSFTFLIHKHFLSFPPGGGRRRKAGTWPPKPGKAPPFFFDARLREGFRDGGFEADASSALGLSWDRDFAAFAPSWAWASRRSAGFPRCLASGFAGLPPVPFLFAPSFARRAGFRPRSSPPSSSLGLSKPGISILLISSPIRRSMAATYLPSSGVARVKACPSRPARPVRPIRWI